MFMSRHYDNNSCHTINVRELRKFQFLLNSIMRLVVSTKVLIYCGFLGIVMVIAGVALGYRIFPSIVNKKVWENSVLQENTTQWGFFKKIPFPFQVKMYFFDVQNVEEILQGEKPVVKEVGPYIYKLFRWKDEIEWSGDKISYYDYTRFEFDQKASGKLSDEDVVTILNAPYNALLLTVEELSPSSLEVVNDALPRIFGQYNGLFTSASVRQLLFQGITICKNGGEGDFATKMICDQFKAKAKTAKGMSVVNKSINYSYLQFKNNTHQGKLTVNSGLKEQEQVSMLIKYNGKNHISVWRNESSVCNQVRSTTTFRPYMTQNMSFDVYSEDICRRLKMDFQGVESVKKIEGYKYAVRNDSFAAPQEHSDNYCYCLNKSRTMNGEFGCLNDGILDMSNCMGAPVLLSFPHLLYGAKVYSDSIEGFQPDPKMHETYVILEPTSGMPLQMAKRVQFNMFIRPIDDITSIGNVTNSLVPIFWFEESMTLEDEYVDLLKTSLLYKLKILEIIKWILIVFGAASVILATSIIIYKK